MPAGSWTTQVTEVFHFAAAYDPSVPRAIAERVNVGGTRHVLQYCARFPQLRAVHYVSTCFVSGRYDGVYRESDLDVGQSFNNFYEESKALAEREVRDAMAGGVPAVIYRPAVVVGDSGTGETQKYDGPYATLHRLLRQPRKALMPMPGRPEVTTFNVVPSDFVARAIGAHPEIGVSGEVSVPRNLAASGVPLAAAEDLVHGGVRHRRVRRPVDGPAIAKHPLFGRGGNGGEALDLTPELGLLVGGPLPGGQPPVDADDQARQRAQPVEMLVTEHQLQPLAARLDLAVRAFVGRPLRVEQGLVQAQQMIAECR